MVNDTTLAQIQPPHLVHHNKNQIASDLDVDWLTSDRAKVILLLN